MYFKDRHHAGKKLADSLASYRNQPNTLVIGLPRGGVVVAFEVAKHLNLPLDIICPRKVGAPHNPELAIGAVTETGQGIMNELLISRLAIPSSYIQLESKKEAAVAKQRLQLYRSGRPTRVLKDQTVLLVDDGLATGATMKAAIQTAKAQGASKIVVAVPVAPPDTAEEMRSLVDEVVILYAPPFFSAVGQFYEQFSSTEDAEVIDLMQQMREREVQ